jgi:acyl carrier protein
MTDALVGELTGLVLEATEKPAPAGGLRADEALFGADARLALDSLDALQVAMAVQARYGLRMTDSKETRRALASVACLAQHVAAHRQRKPPPA